jgi:hypothetical protein
LEEEKDILEPIVNRAVEVNQWKLAGFTANFIKRQKP